MVWVPGFRGPGVPGSLGCSILLQVSLLTSKSSTFEVSLLYRPIATGLRTPGLPDSGIRRDPMGSHGIRDYRKFTSLFTSSLPARTSYLPRQPKCT